jgi:endonuclease G
MPNTQGIRSNNWQQYRVSVDQVEPLTGYDFFSNVPLSIQSIIESVVDKL